MSALSRAVHRSTAHIIYRYFAAACLLTAAIFCWQAVASAVSVFNLQMIAPEGGEVSGLVGLEAHSTVKAVGVSFEIESQETDYRLSVPATRGTTDSMVWVGSWDSLGAPVGWYWIKAYGTTPEGEESFSTTVAIYLRGEPGAAGSTTSNIPAVEILKPQSAATVSGMFELVARTNTRPDSLVFLVSGEKLSAVIPVQASPSGTDAWAASWDSRQVPSGSYNLVAQSMLPTGVISSPSVPFNVQHTELTVQVTRPAEGSVQSGLILFQADTSEPVASLKFSVSDSVGATVATGIVARQTMAAEWTSWEAEWDSANLISGLYQVVADVDGKKSAPVSFELEGLTESATASQEPSDETAATTDSQTRFVTVVEPANNSELAGAIMLRAVSSIGTEKVKFLIRSAAGAQDVIVIQSIYNATANGWIAEFDTTVVPDGSYVLWAEAISGGTSLQSETVSLSINNGIGQLPEELAVRISSPQSGARVVGMADLVASTTDTADSVIFRVTPLSSGLGSGSYEITAQPSMGRLSWGGVWELGAVPSGEYQVTALASRGSEAVVSDPIVLEVIQQTGIRVTLLSPTPRSDWSSMIILAAKTEPQAISLEFVVRQVGVAGGEYRVEAEYDSAISAWAGELEATSLLPGKYSIEAVAFDAVGTTHVSPQIEINLIDENQPVDEVQPTDEGEMLVAVLHPAAGQGVSGYYELVAETSGPVSSLKYVIEPDASDAVSAPMGVSIAASQDSAGLWSTEWNSRLIPNGAHRLRAVAAADDGSVAYSEWLPITIDNQLDVVQDLSELAIISPGNGATVGEIVSISLRSTVTLGQVSVVVEGAGELDYADRLAAKRVDDQNWLAAWSTADVPAGEYVLSAVGETTDSSVVSGQVKVIVPDPADKESAETTADDPQSEEEESATVTETEPANLALIAPAPGVAKGVVLLLAESNWPARDIEFVLRNSATGKIVLVRKAAFEQSRQQWVSYWHATNSSAGLYLLHARGMDESGLLVKSRTVELEVLPPPSPEEAPAEEEPVAKTIVQVPDDAVRASVLEVPEGTAVSRTTDEPVDLGDQDQRLNAECAAAEVSPARCPLWLAERYGAPECRQAGIITKSECLAYLAELQGGRLAECASYDQAACQEYAAEKTQGLLDDQELDDLNTQVVSLIGRAVVLPPDNAGSDDLPADVAARLSITGDGRTRVRMHASPGYVQVDEQSSRRSIPAVILIDTDGDGLPDDTERRLGTDPRKADTDGDGYEDGAEIRNGYDPLGSGQLTDQETDRRMTLAPVDVALLSGLPLEQPRQAGKTSEQLTVGLSGFNPDAGTADVGQESEPADDGKLLFSGTAQPGEVVTLFIYSYLPVVMTAVADENGVWSYELDQNLVDGRHEVYVAVTDDTGRIKEKSAPFEFFVAQAQAVSGDSFFGLTVLDEDPYMSPAEVTQREFNWYIFGAISLVALALVIGMIIVLRPRRTADYRDL